MIHMGLRLECVCMWELGSQLERRSLVYERGIWEVIYETSAVIYNLSYVTSHTRELLNTIWSWALFIRDLGSQLHMGLRLECVYMGSLYTRLRLSTSYGIETWMCVYVRVELSLYETWAVNFIWDSYGIETWMCMYVRVGLSLYETWALNFIWDWDSDRVCMRQDERHKMRGVGVCVCVCVCVCVVYVCVCVVRY